MSECEVFPDPYFPILGLYTNIYYVDLLCKSPYSVQKSVFGHFSLSVLYKLFSIRIQLA